MGLDASSEMVWALLGSPRAMSLVSRFLLQIIVPGLAGEAGWLMSWARESIPT